MFKIGNAFLNESDILAIAPNKLNGFTAFLSSGAQVSFDASEADIRAALSEAGLVDGGELVAANPEEIAELINLDEQGFRYIARDKTDKAYAYRVEPKRSGAYWDVSQLGSKEDAASVSLHSDFDFLTCDNSPIVICDILEAQNEL